MIKLEQGDKQSSVHLARLLLNAVTLRGGHMALAVTPTLTLDTRRPRKLCDFTAQRTGPNMLQLRKHTRSSKLEEDLKDVFKEGTCATLSFSRRPDCVRLGSPSSTPGVYQWTVSSIGDRTCA
jgi:hypothetical protein